MRSGSSSTMAARRVARPMLHRALEQFLSDVYWGPLDYLLIDMPPGTGDVGLSLGQLLPARRPCS